MADIPISGGFVNTDQSVSSVVVSGANTALTAPATFSGPHAIERQTMKATYCRVPVGAYLSESWGVSGPVVTHTTHKTLLLTTLEATWSMTKSYEKLPVSSFSQPQLFAINAVSSDPYGNTGYGTLAAGQLGCMGNVDTSVPYMSIEPWDTTNPTHVVATSSIIGATFIASTSALPAYKIYENQSTTMFDFNRTFNPTSKWGSADPWWTKVNSYSWSPTDNYTLMGYYQFAQETTAQRNIWLDSLGEAITARHLYTIPATATQEQCSPGFVWAGCPQGIFIGIPEYSRARHSYQ